MRESDVTNWATFKQWVGERQHPKLGNFSEYWFTELQHLLCASRTGEIVQVDVDIERIPLTKLSGGSKDREKRLAKYSSVLHENAWQLYILIHCDHPGRKENEQYSMRAYYGAFLRDKSGKLVYFRALDDKKGMDLWNMPALAKQLTKE